MLHQAAKAGVAAAASYTQPCFGYTGTFKSGSTVMTADYDANGTPDECFGIAPNRTIWHAWKNSGGWRQMPNGGLADDTAWYAGGEGNRVVAVSVNNVGDYCANYTPATGWQSWYTCD